MRDVFELPSFKLELPSPSGSLPNLKQAHEKLQDKIRSKSVGFYDWPLEISSDEIANIKRVAKEIRSTFSAVICVGIGGSFLGAAALMDALRDPKDDKKLQVYWLSNVDRTSLSFAASIIQEKKTAFLFLSKSGNTVETLSALYAFHGQLGKTSTYIVTDSKKGELRRLAQENGWTSFSVPENIGGRFSVFTSVGLFPLEVSGVDTTSLIEGARAMRSYLTSQAPEKNPAYLYAVLANQWCEKENRNIHVLMPYDCGLAKTGDWFVQLWAESIGKKRKTDGKAVGFTPIRCLGTTDQHSQLQLFKEGPQDKVVGFMDVHRSKTQALPKNPYVSSHFAFLTRHSIEDINHQASLAVEKSLQLSGTPTYRFSFPEISGKTLGSFLFFQMTACAFAGELFQVDAFDQPGVEEAKRLLAQAL